MLDPLSGGDQARVHGDVVEVLLKNRLALLEDAFHAFARLGSRRLAQQLEGLLDASHLAFGFAQVIGKRLRQRLVRGGLHHLRQGFRDLLLGVIDVAQLVQKRVVQCACLSHESLQFQRRNPRDVP